MTKRTTFTTTTALPADVTRSAVLDFLHSHAGMIDLNPLVVERHVLARPPAHCPPDEARCEWWSVTDRISYLPGIGNTNTNTNNTTNSAASASSPSSLLFGKVTYSASFHDMPDGVQTHCYAPMGTHIRSRWRLGGTLPGERRQVVELGIGAPSRGLYIREDVELSCNFVMAGFVKKTLKKAHGTLVEALVAKARSVKESGSGSSSSGSASSSRRDGVPEGPTRSLLAQQQQQQHRAEDAAVFRGEAPVRVARPPADSLDLGLKSDPPYSAVASRYSHGTTSPRPPPRQDGGAPGRARQHGSAPVQHRQYGAAYAAVLLRQRDQQPATGTAAPSAPGGGESWSHEAAAGFDARSSLPEGRRALVSEME